jgi:exopolyphosphatase/guanosine-5'-triphosphate,3'-diphosphate pyrophosphatase
MTSNNGVFREGCNLKFAAIDIGTNAVRLLLSRVIESGTGAIFKKESLVRMPIRLGEDVFASRIISERKIENLVKTVIAFRNLIEAYEAVDYRACATSAVREAENGAAVVNEIKRRAGIELEVIDGRREAQIICSNRPDRIPNEKGSFLYIDVGGGSTDMTFFSGDRTIDTASFNIGGLRILAGLVSKSDWKEMKKWLKDTTAGYREIYAIGSGGNINKIFRMARKKESEAISYKKIKEIYKYLNSFTLEERIQSLKLRPDRADVIIPAAEIYLAAMKWAGIKEMYVPVAGLSDGLVRLLYEEHKQRQKVGEIR